MNAKTVFFILLTSTLIFVSYYLLFPGLSLVLLNETDKTIKGTLVFSWREPEDFELSGGSFSWKMVLGGEGLLSVYVRGDEDVNDYVCAPYDSRAIIFSENEEPRIIFVKNNVWSIIYKCVFQ